MLSFQKQRLSFRKDSRAATSLEVVILSRQRAAKISECAD